MGGEGIHLPTFAEQQAAFDEALIADAEPLSGTDQEQMELRRALGVA